MFGVHWFASEKQCFLARLLPLQVLLFAFSLCVVVQSRACSSDLKVHWLSLNALLSLTYPLAIAVLSKDCPQPRTPRSLSGTLLFLSTTQLLGRRVCWRGAGLSATSERVTSWEPGGRKPNLRVTLLSVAPISHHQIDKTTALEICCRRTACGLVVTIWAKVSSPTTLCHIVI